MTLAQRTPLLENLVLANGTREVRSRQRRALRGAPPRTMLPVLIDPPPELASYKIWELFRGRENLIPRLSERKLGRILASLNSRPGCGRVWHEEIRLRDLSTSERRALVREILQLGPKAWRNVEPHPKQRDGVV